MKRKLVSFYEENNYKKIRLLGEGSYGKVYKVLD